ncbi:hypothetical protein [Lysobacter niastensis]|uniref:Uncharacterized protein n=1 Tax=Lysobacter niastensis TaxID=380629 RepID=A0ABS0BE33_9GAMM|nr:hypothetical protein [Lysobacter niastensis]MBF6025947.1 hypothetical protein [Lysobacter niastensis]
MRRSQGMMVLSCAIAVLAALVPAGRAVGAEGGEAVPLLWESPGCDHDKLGTVEIEAGERVSEQTRDLMVPLVDYGRAMKRLSEAAQQRGGNAVVLRWHQGVYFTRNGKQSRKPVYVKLRGAAIRLPAPEQCRLQLVDADELEARSLGGKPVNVSSGDAYAGE